MTEKKVTGRRGAARTLIAVFVVALTRRTASAKVHDEVRAALEALFSQLPSARAVGAVYLRSGAADGLDPTTLAASLPVGMSAIDLRSAIGARIRDDFANARVVTVDGWMLAVTEAKLCALACLHA